MQLINVAFGGTLTQDLSLLKAPLQHEQSEPRAEAGHGVEILENTLLSNIVGSSQLGVNSTHHQVIGDLGDDLMISASASDGVVEAIESTNHAFVLGVQWHPEAMAMPSSNGSSALILRLRNQLNRWPPRQVPGFQTEQIR